MAAQQLCPEGISIELGRKVAQDPLGFLLSGSKVPAHTFLGTYWEKKPLHIKANAQLKEFFSGVCSFEAISALSNALAVRAIQFEEEAEKRELARMDKALKEGAEEEEEDIEEEEDASDEEEEEEEEPPRPLLWGLDVNCVRYAEGVRENLVDEDGGLCEPQSLEDLYRGEGGTLQFHQPQRFDDRLWLLCAALERDMECLVGSNVYVTPKGSQGLAPHHDDVELWVCQTVGSKHWRLYSPYKGHDLPTQPSPDLDPSQIGEPILEVTLHPGDVLYLPRGTIHQAVAQTEDSAHVTVSTYQRWNVGEAAGFLLHHCMREQGEEGAPRALRAGLPVGFLSSAGFMASNLHGHTAKDHASLLAKAYRAMADMVEAKPHVVHGAADMLSVDYMESRLPPHPLMLPENNGPPPDEACRVRVVGKTFVRVNRVPKDESSPDGPGLIKVISCLMNDRESHMIGGPEDSEDEEDEGMGGEGMCEDENCGDPHHHHHHHHGHGEEEEEEEEEEAEVPAKGKKASKAAPKEEDEVETEEGEEEDDSEDGDDADGSDDFGSDSEGEQDDEIVFPEELGPALSFLLDSAAEDGVALSDIPIPDLVSGDEVTAEDKVGYRLAICTALWEVGLLMVLPGKAAGKRKREAEEGGKASGKKAKGEEADKGKGKGTPGKGAGKGKK